MPIENAPKAATTKRGPVPTAEFKAPDNDNVTRAGFDSNESKNVQTDIDGQVPYDDPAKAQNVPASPATTQDDFVFVQMPDGQFRAVRKSEIQKIGAFDNPDGTPEVPDQEMYVWLADGSVERVKESKLPGSAGTNAAHGYFERDNKMHHIVGVYPVEHEKG